MPGITLPPIFVVLDTETSGMRPDDGHSIVEIAAQKVVGRQVVEEFVTLVNPGHLMDRAAMEIHGISQAQLEAEGRLPAQVFADFEHFVKALPLIAHNVGFDMAFLHAHYDRLLRPRLTNPTIDSIGLARQVLLLPSYSLQSVARFLQIPQPNAHRALGDVETLRQVLFALADRSK